MNEQKFTSHEVEALRKAAATLANARQARLEGNIRRTYTLEGSGEKMLNYILSTMVGGGELIDTLMTSWENSLAEHPRQVEEWRELNLWSIEECSHDHKDPEGYITAELSKIRQTGGGL